MNPNPEMVIDTEVSPAPPTEVPSMDFIHAISEFLDTDPDDLLVELGYYHRTDEDVSSRA